MILPLTRVGMGVLVAAVLLPVSTAGVCPADSVMLAKILPPISFVMSRRLLTVLTALAGVGISSAQSKPEHPGAVIYREMCMDCHGKNGEGVAGKYDKPLQGTRTVDSLAGRIDRTMPEDNEEACDAEQSAQVAAYIYDSFYSPIAQARLKPARKDLTRLTVAQYQTAITDLIGRFRPGFDKQPGTVRGLKAFYSGLAKPPGGMPVPDRKGDGPDPRPRAKFDRIDDKVDFSFGEASPDMAQLAPTEFSIRWEGSVIAPETGAYEFIVKSENGVRFSINDRKDPVIDAWVSSGPDVREEKKSVYLLGGRAYPVTLEFFKFKEKSASVKLEWKPPHGVQEVIPQRHLTPDRPRDNFVVGTTFPADDRSEGYERGTGVSKSWDQATTEGAIATADHVEKFMDELSGSKPGTPERVDKLKEFSRKFIEAAFRRPLSDEEKKRYVELQFEKAPTPDLAVKRVVLLTLKSPYFLYAELPDGNAPDSFDVAARLALNLWDSIPDAKLIKAATEGKLVSREQVAGEARRMLQDPRTKTKLHGFFQHWLELERADGVSKDMKMFPGFDERVLADLRTSLWMFVDQVVWSEHSDYRELLQADYLWLNDRLAKLYSKGDPGESDPSEAFQRMAFDPKQRNGVITHPYLLAAFAYNKQSSPIHRGVFLTRNIVGMSLNPPPDAVEFDDAHFDPTLTMREKVTSITKDSSCMGCHAVINPLGFSLENFDAIGRWRTKDNNKPVNPEGTFDTDEGKPVKLTGARDVAMFAATSKSGHLAFIRQLFNHMVKQPAPAYGNKTLESLRAGFESSGFNIQKLMVDIALLASTQGMPAPVTTVVQQKPPAPKPAPAAPAGQASASGAVVNPSPAPAPVKPATPPPAPAPKVEPPKAQTPPPMPAVVPPPAPNPKPAAPQAPAPAPAVAKPEGPKPAPVPPPATTTVPAPAPASVPAPQQTPQPPSPQP